jgi:hypothetical protein
VPFFCQYPFAKKLQSQNVTREKLRKALSYKKCAHKMLMKLTRGQIVLQGITNGTDKE